MSQCRASHQLLIGFQGLEHLQRIVHMVNVEHHQTVQMAVCQPTMTKGIAIDRRRCVKLIAAKDKRRQVILQLLCKGLQPLLVALLKEFLTRTEFDLRSSLLTLGRVGASSTLLSLNRSLLQSSLLSQKLPILLILQPLINDLRIVSFHSLQNLPSAINLPGSRCLANLFPELLSAAPDGLREVSVFLITESLHTNSFN